MQKYHLLRMICDLPDESIVDVINHLSKSYERLNQFRKSDKPDTIEKSKVAILETIGFNHLFYLLAFGYLVKPEQQDDICCMADQTLVAEELAANRLTFEAAAIMQSIQSYIRYAVRLSRQPDSDLELNILSINHGTALAVSTYGWIYSQIKELPQAAVTFRAEGGEIVKRQGVKVRAEGRYGELNKFKHKVGSIAQQLWNDGKDFNHIEMAKYIEDNSVDEFGKYSFGHLPGNINATSKNVLTDVTKKVAKAMGREDLVFGTRKHK